MSAPPSVSAVRPARCPCCGAPGAAAGRPKALVGHGLRSRILLGPASPDDRPEVAALEARRYRCRRCGAIVVSLPRGVLRRLRYTAVAIALALAMWADGASSAAVRTRISPFTIVGDDAVRGWRSLRRWARSARRLWPPIRPAPHTSPRPLAADVVRQLAALAPLTTGALVRDACAGALRC